MNDPRLTTPSVQLDDSEMERVSEICRFIPGYSDLRHYRFFRQLLAVRDIRTILMLGVYFGRDIALLLEAARRGGRGIAITGVDKFADDACDDWPAALRACSWQEAGFGPAPSLEAAGAHIGPYKQGATVHLVRRHDADFLAECRAAFDLIYLDTSHDFDTVSRQIRQAAPLLAPGGLLAGDDYSDAGTWGVRRAVSAAAPRHAVWEGWVWLAGKADLGFAEAA